MLHKPKYDAVVVGSGPNGLAAAITLARAGCLVLVVEAKDTLGGGTRSSNLTLPGFLHDVCSAIHPLGIASPFFRSIDLAQHGLHWVNPPVPLAHPLDDGTAVLLERSIDITADALGLDGQSYRHLMVPLTKNWDKLLGDVLGPLRLPRHPLTMMLFGYRAIRSMDYLARRWFKTDRARALFAGIAAHSIMPLHRAGGGAAGLILSAAGHVVGWPLPRGGSQTISDSLARYFISLGGEVRTSFKVRSCDDLPQAKAVLFDVTPKQLAIIAGDRFRSEYKKRLLEHQYGPGVFKIDWALDGPIPWKSSDCMRTATVHIGGTFQEIAEAENMIWEGKHPEKPLVILAQQSLFDSTRVPNDKQSAWGYCHVPNGSTIDMSERIEAQIERFAPGFRERILARYVMNTSDIEAYNPNYIGGDIAGGFQDPFRLLIRPLGQRRAYATPVKGFYLCSSSMPPGPGVHGMCGYHAAQMALREVF